MRALHAWSGSEESLRHLCQPLLPHPCAVVAGQVRVRREPDMEARRMRVHLKALLFCCPHRANKNHHPLYHWSTYPVESQINVLKSRQSATRCFRRLFASTRRLPQVDSSAGFPGAGLASYVLRALAGESAPIDSACLLSLQLNSCCDAGPFCLSPDVNPLRSLRNL